MGEMYKPEIKGQYLKTLPEQTAKIVKYAFYKSFIIEDTLKKDLCEFTNKEIEQVLASSNSKTEAGVRNTLSYINSYLKWAASNGYRNSNIVLNDIEDLRRFVSNVKLFFTNEEIDELIDDVDNSQDKVVLQLAFYEGVQIEELINLHYNNIDWRKGIIKLEHRDDLHISDKSLRLMESAYHDDKYINTNSETERELVRSDYIIRNTVSARTKNVQGVQKSTVYTRLMAIRDNFEFEDFTYKTLTKSGMIYEGYKLFMEEGELGSDQLNRIGDKFGVKKYNINGYLYHNTTILKNLISRENILNLYNVDIDK